MMVYLKYICYSNLYLEPEIASNNKTKSPKNINLYTYLNTTCTSKACLEPASGYTAPVTWSKTSLLLIYLLNKQRLIYLPSTDYLVLDHLRPCCSKWCTICAIYIASDSDGMKRRFGSRFLFRSAAFVMFITFIWVDGPSFILGIKWQNMC